METPGKESEASAALYEYAAAVFLEPVPTPGTAWIRQMLTPTRHLATCANGAPGISDLSAWCNQLEHASTDELAAAQRAVAIDRTRLCRGVDGKLLPPYESYWADGASSATVTNMTRLYSQAHVHFAHDGIERDDFIGVEFAFAAHLARSERTEDERLFRLAFEREHLFAWLPAYGNVAVSVAGTELFRGLLAFLSAYAHEA